jgi:branched-chain amino acid aminotransferase
LSSKQYINYNGFLYEDGEKVFSIKNRAFRYGDALFESIRIRDGHPCFIEDHFKRLKKGMEILKMQPTELSFNELKEQMVNLIRKNGIKKGGRIRLTVFRSGDGLYTPENEGKSYVIEARSMKNNDYTLNETGLNIDVYNELRRSISPLSQIKTTNNIPHVLTGIYKKENNLDDCLVLNHHGRIVEAISSNIFLYKNHNLYTTSIEEGCMDGVMRKQILKIAKELNINVFEGMLTGSMLLQSDELFLTNAISGIKWVVSYRQKRYFNKATKEILEKLNELEAVS